MIQFVYGQVATADLKVFNEISERLRGNMAKLTAKQLAQTVYTLVRTNLPQVREVINEGIAVFHQKTKDKPSEYSQERVTVLWSASKSANLDFKLYEQMLKTEIVNIEKYNDRIFVQLVNSIGVLSPDIETKTLKDLLEQMASFLEKNGRYSLQITQILFSAGSLGMRLPHLDVSSEGRGQSGLQSNLQRSLSFDRQPSEVHGPEFPARLLHLLNSVSQSGSRRSTSGAVQIQRHGCQVSGRDTQELRGSQERIG